MKKIASVSIIIILIALFFIPLANAENIINAKFETLDKGDILRGEDDNSQHNLEIYNQQEWQDFLNKHTSGYNHGKKFSLPEVDFNDWFVVVAIDEQRPHLGYTFEIEAIDIYDTKSSYSLGNHHPLEIKIKQGGAGGISGQMIIRPYHIVKVERPKK